MLFHRLFTIARAYVQREYRQSQSPQDTQDADAGSRFNSSEDSTGSFSDGTSTNSNSAHHPAEELPSKVVEALEILDLSHPVSFQECKLRRNEYMLRHHPDKFMQNDEKAAIANEIARLYNGAFETLVHFYTAHHGTQWKSRK